MTRPLSDRLLSLPITQIDVKARRPIGQYAINGPILLEAGWALRAVPAADGRRQIAQFFMPGDLILPPPASFGTVLEALTDCRIAVPARPQGLVELCREEAARRDVIALLYERESLGDALLYVLGQMPALERLAWLILHLHARSQAAGRVEDGVLAFPLTQLDVADALGLSLVHANKSIARLRREGILLWDRHRLQLLDLDRLKAICSFPYQPG